MSRSLLLCPAKSASHLIGKKRCDCRDLELPQPQIRGPQVDDDRRRAADIRRREPSTSLVATADEDRNIRMGIAKKTDSPTPDLTGSADQQNRLCPSLITF